MNKSDLVSVILPSYNHEKYVEASINSVLNQTYPNIEIIVIDDGSRDNTPAIIQKMAERFPENITFVNRKSNKGVPTTWNELLSYVNGKFLTPFASDDLLPPTALEKRVKFMLEHPDVDVLLTDFDGLSADGEIVQRRKKLELVPQFKRLYEIDFNNLYTELLRGNFLPGGAVIIRLERISKEEIYQDPLCPNLSDYDLWLRLSFKYRWAYLPESTWVYRWHGNNFSFPANPKNSDLIVTSQMLYILSKQLLQPQLIHQKELTVKIINHLSKKIDFTLKYSLDAQKFLTENKISEAIEVLSKLLLLEPDASSTHNQIGECYFKLKQHRSALKSFMKAVRLNPQDRLAVLNLIMILTELKQNERAIRILSAFLKSNPEDVEALLLLAELYLRKGNKTKSLEICKDVLTNDPYNQTALMSIRQQLS
ncbi:MAG: glycosyltransferase [bacterium]